MDRRREEGREGKWALGEDSDFLGQCADDNLRPVSGAASGCYGCQDEASMDWAQERLGEEGPEGNQLSYFSTIYLTRGSMCAWIRRG